MGIIYREDKGEPLTIDEVDGNFRDLDQRLQEIETEKKPSKSMRINKDTAIYLPEQLPTNSERGALAFVSFGDVRLSLVYCDGLAWRDLLTQKLLKEFVNYDKDN